MKKYIFFFIIILSSCLNSFGQLHDLHIKTPKEQELFKTMKYQAYIDLVNKRISKGDELTLKTKQQLGESYRQIGDSFMALSWYASFIEDAQESILYYRYTQLLLMNERCEEAKTAYQTYLKLADDPIELKINCNAEQANILITNLAAINTPKIEMSPMYYKEGIVYNTNNTDKVYLKEDKWLGTPFMDVIYVDAQLKRKTGTFKSLNTEIHEGQLCFSKDGEKVYFTRTYENQRNKQPKTLKIFTAQLKNGTWTNITKLPNQRENINYFHPTISSQGDTLYFASDQFKEKNGSDLYFSHIKNGTWTKPTRLDNTVNSKGDEAFPYFHEDGTLYFASNGHGNLGGLDIYETRLSNGNWQKPKALPSPINSIKDDFGFITNKDKTTGYFTSNRKGGKGADDIYQFEYQLSFSSTLEALSVCVEDKSTGAKIPNARVLIYTFTDAYTQPITKDALKAAFTEMDFYTNEEGIFNAPLDSDKWYIFEVIQEGYKAFYYPYYTKRDETNFCVPVYPQDCRKLVGQAMNRQTNTPFKQTVISIKNECDGSEKTTLTDEAGNFQACIDCSCSNYTVSVIGTGMTRELKTVRIDNEEHCIKGVSQVVVWAKPPTPPLPFADPKNIEDFTNSKSSSFNISKLREGQIIRLPRVFYDFDESFIREVSKPDLNGLIRLMNTFPSMTIELSAHTDARGSNPYNQRLSQRRADAALQYLLQNGISPNRVVSRGYGETQPLNECRDGVECTETAHQYNRRTEFRIVKLDQQEVAVYQMNNAPKVIDPKE